MKRQSTEWKKIFSNEATDKGLTSKNTNKTCRPISKKKKKIKKWAEDLSRHFSKVDISPKTDRWQKNTWKDAQHCWLLEKCKSELLWGTTLNQPEYPSSKSLQTVNAGKGEEKKEPPYTVGKNVNWYSHYGKQYGGSSKN